jgi:hypothetical protein
MHLSGIDLNAPPRAAKAVAAASLNTYEAAARAHTELQWLLARHAIQEPIGALLRAWADVTRDVIAVQMSTARWLLDL